MKANQSHTKTFFKRLTLIAVFVLLCIQSYKAQYTIGGSAVALAGDCWRLTPATNGQGGYVYQNQAIDLNQPFDLTFDVYLGTNNGGADGIVFVLRGSLASPYIGNNGGAIGYNGAGFSSNSLGIEVDTWFNGGFGDIAADHIGILKNGTVNHNSANSLAGPLQASATNANVEDGNYHTFNVRWDPAAEELEVYLDCDYRLQYSGDMINDVFNGDNTVFWGFLGTTGGANNDQRFCLTESIDSLVYDLSDATICNGDSVQLDAGESAPTYSWTPSAGLSSSISNSPWASPSSTTTYNVEISHNCDTILDTATVNVIQPSFNALGLIDDVDCNGECDGSIDLSVNNGSGIYGFDWSTNDSIEDINSLCAGTYTVTVQDIDTTSSEYLCFLEESFTVGEPPLLVASVVNETKTSCPDGSTCDAEATASVTGGTFPYNYLWTSTEITQMATLLCADTNWLTVTDAKGCEDSAFVFIDIPDSIVTTAFGDTQICISNIASIIGATTGGTPPYSYIWREASLNGTVVSTNQSTQVSPPITTQYFIESVDAKGCPGDTSEVLVKVRPALFAELEAKDTICPYDTIPVRVEGFGGDTSYTFSWSSGQFGPEIIVSPDQSQWYVVTVSDFCGTPSYKDSVFVQVGGHQDIGASIRVEDDSICQGESVYLIADGIGGFSGPEEYEFRWSQTDEKSNVAFVRPSKTSTYTLTITDLCLSEPGISEITIHVGKPHVPNFTAEPGIACAATDVMLQIANYNYKYDYTWWLDDSTQISTEGSDSIFLKFNEEGCHSIEVSSVTDFGCTARRREECIVQILRSPEADFVNDPERPSNNNQMVTFQDNSSRSEQVIWYVQGDTLYNTSIFQRHFPDSLSDLEISMVAISDQGCVDTLNKTLEFVYYTQVFIPSSFTPNGDQINEVWYIQGQALSPQDFDLTVYDRWGRQAFKASHPRRGWDGFYPNGERAPQGVYPFVLQYRDELGELRTIRDQVIISAGGRQTGLR